MSRRWTAGLLVAALLGAPGVLAQPRFPVGVPSVRPETPGAPPVGKPSVEIQRRLEALDPNNPEA